MGRVTIKVDVETLTLRPEEVAYDSGGRSRTTTALVGAPAHGRRLGRAARIDPATVVAAAPDATAPA